MAGLRLFGSALLLQLLALGVWARGETFLVDLSARPLTRVLAAYDVAIVKPDAAVERPFLATTKTQLFAWMEWKVDREGKLLLLPSKVEQQALAAGFAGAVLVCREPGTLKSEGFATAVGQFKQRFPALKIWISAPASFLPASRSLADGWLSLPTRGQETAARHKDLQDALTAGWKVWAVDWLPRTEVAAAQARATALAALGVTPLVTTEEMIGITLAPWQVAARRILVLFGAGDAEPGDPPAYEANTLTATRLQMALEWAGYEVVYFNVEHGMPPPALAADCAGIIFDSLLQLPFSREKEYADWVLSQRAQGMKLLFVGKYPFEQEVELNRVMLGLGLRGSYDPLKNPRFLKITTLDDKLMNAEAKVLPQNVDFNDIRAPLEAKVALGQDAQDETANPRHYDAVYTTTWGGAVLDPYLTFQSSGATALSYFDPFVLLDRIWPMGKFPAPDTTTRDGLRIFYSHIDGDGFVYETAFDKKKLCGEVIRDEVLKKYPYPVTCSVIEAEVRCDQADLKDADAARYQAVARSMFALPNVQAASHSYSHPFVWVDADEDFLPLYEERNLRLKPAAAYPQLNMQREVAGSILYIEKELLPEGKKIELMLWSGNCRPGEEALKVCEEMGVANLNGGNTTITKRHPGVSIIGPATMTWNGHRQIHASNQNEFAYTRNWSGPFYNGFQQVKETFELTETPRRLKPVNVYYHFYSASQLGSLKALTEVLDWTLTQSLHVLTAREFADLVSDSADAQLLQTGPESWRAITTGHLRTFRLPTGSAVPDGPRCQGVLGWCQTPQGIYVHTDGSRVIYLTLIKQNKAKDHVTSGAYLVTSSAPLRLSLRTGETLRLVVEDFRPECQVRLGGLAPQSSWDLRAADHSQRLTADALGFLDLKLKGHSEAEVHPAP